MTAWLKNLFRQSAKLATAHPGREAASPPEQDMRNMAEALKSQGNEHYVKGELEMAAACYQKAIEVDPDYADAYNNLGAIHRQKNLFDEALVCYRKAIALNPALAKTHNNLASLLAEMGRHAAVPNNPARGEMLRPAEMNQFVVLFNAGRYLEVESQMRLVCEQHPNSGFAWKMLGASLLVQGKEALPALRKATELLPDDADAHSNLGNALKELGQLDSAVASCRRAVEINPDFAGAHYNLGNALKALGQLDNAVASYAQALAIKPDHAETHVNLGLALQALGKLDEAVTSYAQALEIKPDFAMAHFNLGNALRDWEQLDGALESYRYALEANPDFAEAHSNLGIVLQDLGRLDGAVASFRRALEINPDFAEAHSNLGCALHALGQLDDAEKNFRRALEIKPGFAMACNNLASLLNDQGKSEIALNLVNLSLRLEETREAKRLFVSSVKSMHFSQLDNDILTNLIRALSEPWCRPNELGRVAADFVKLNSDIGSTVARVSLSWPRQMSAQELFEPAGFVTVAGDPLLRALLESTPVCDIDLERFLTMARRVMLDTANGAAIFDCDDGLSLGFFVALARQCFINEYVFSWGDDESERARKLRDSLVASLEAETPIPAVWPVAVAAYFPLYSLPNADRLLERSWPDTVSAILVQQVREPEEERQCRATMLRLTPIEDDVSLSVQNQYEKNPYPRWITAPPAGKSTNIDGSLRRSFPLAHFQPFGNTRSPEILIAGCGTGQHPIQTARQFREARVLAIDLSLTSLCYAKRKTHELGLTSIEYAQADILQLGSIGRRFDVIESSGVLHHLDDPWAGWRVLLSLLRPGGFMRLGFYSEVARRDIVRARNFIAEQGYGSSVEDIRQCRQDLMGLDESAGFGYLFKLSDMFSTSDCRDLIFHVQEHRMTLTGIEIFLRKNALQFLGFDIDSRLLHAYRLRFPDDRAATNLNQWQVFENENPYTFIAMYQFWVQKGVGE